MPFSMKIQPIDCSPCEAIRLEPARPVVVKSRFKRLFERQIISASRTLAAEKTCTAYVPGLNTEKDGPTADETDFDPSSVCLTKMVQNFIEDSNDKHSSTIRCGRNRCNCFGTDSSDEERELDFPGRGKCCFGDFHGEPCELLKSLVLCPTLCERNLLADTARIVEREKTICKRKDDAFLKVVIDGLLSIGYDASLCKCRWEKAPSYPAGEYEYIDVIIKGERLVVDIDFRSEFEIARPTRTYKSILLTLPTIFVGNPNRLRKIITIVSEAVRQSLKKKGMHVPPWRKAEYVEAKWFSPHTRSASPIMTENTCGLIKEQNKSSPGNSNMYKESLETRASCSIDDGPESVDSLFSLSQSSGDQEIAGRSNAWMAPKPSGEAQELAGW